ncbi:MAG: hypothetical protein HKM07_06515, partial [Chlamydiae bacterium]|nr:hypothetical protein [Chlamydiota bacterium]
MNNIMLNPFSLPSACAAWQNPDPDSSLVTRFGKTFSAGMYDIYVGNPYKMVVENTKELNKGWNSLSRLEKAAITTIVSLSSLYTLILYGSTLYLQGKWLLALGSHTSIALVEKIGAIVQKVGLGVFLTGAVPLYGLFYALPKYIITSIPTIAHFAYTQITLALKMIAAKVAFVAQWTFQHTLAPLWNYVVVPVAKGIGHAVVLLTKGIAHAVSAVAHVVAQAAQWTFQHTLVPLWNY